MLPLNDKEQAIMELICKGKTSEEVAQIIGSTKNGVHASLRIVYPKLDAHNRAEACANFAKRQRP